METNKILFWILLATQLIYMVVEFFTGNIAFGFNCLWFAITVYLLIRSYKSIEKLERKISFMPDPDIVRSNFVATIDNNIVTGDINYAIHQGEYGYWVYAYSEKDNICFSIKFFSFDDDEEYAKLCAEELLEMLNEK